MSIVTITLNPAIDQTVFVDGLTINRVNRARAMQFDAGGKGVNVASFLADYGLPPIATGLLGRDNAAIFEQHFQRKAIADRFVRVEGATRMSIKLADGAHHQTTDINMPGQTPSAEALGALWATIAELSAAHEWFVIAGNVPPGVPPSLIGELVRELRAAGRRVALDVSGQALADGLRAGPSLAKPNRDELAELGYGELADDAALAAAVGLLHAQGVGLAIISLGRAGAIFSDGEAIIHAEPPAVQVASTVGAGDAMVAGTLAALHQGGDLAACARLATAFSLAAISRIGAHLGSRAELDQFAGQVRLRQLEPTRHAG